MFPDSVAAPHLSDGSFVRVSDVHLDVPLFWRCWKLDSPIVKRITDAVQSAATDLWRRPKKSS
jgi:LysR family transcriptional regulator, chromosome initiation inhibitor